MVWTVVLSVVDGKGALSSTEFNLPDATSHADARLMAGEMAKLIGPLVTGRITRIGLVQDVPVPGSLTAAAQLMSDVEEGARFQFETVNGFTTAMRLATFDEGKIVSGSREVDLTDTAVTAFVNAMHSGIDLTAAGGSATVAPCDKRGEDINLLVSAREQFQSSR